MTTLRAAEPDPAGLDRPPQKGRAPDRRRDQRAAEARFEERRDLLRPPVPGQLAAPERARAAPSRAASAGSPSIRSSAAAAASRVARRHQQRVLAVAQQLGGVGRGRREDRPAGGEIGEELHRQHAIAEPLERRPRRRDQQRVGGAGARRAGPPAPATARSGRWRAPPPRPRSGPRPSDPTSTNRTSGPQVGQRQDLVEPLLARSPARHRARPADPPAARAPPPCATRDRGSAPLWATRIFSSATPARR